MKILATALAVLFACPAYAAQCLDRETFIAIAAEQYGEHRAFSGLTEDRKAFVEVYVNDATGTWTMIVTTPDGQACIASAGDAFEYMNDPLPPAGEVN